MTYFIRAGGLIHNSVWLISVLRFLREWSSSVLVDWCNIVAECQGFDGFSNTSHNRSPHASGRGRGTSTTCVFAKEGVDMCLDLEEMGKLFKYYCYDGLCQIDSGHDSALTISNQN